MRAAVALVLTSFAVAPQAPVDVTTLGPQVGARVTDFSLTDQQGRTQSLKTAAGSKGTMLVFFRSADWWPYCRTQLVELQRNLSLIRKEGYGLLALSYDSTETLTAFAERHRITFPLLSDTGSKVIDAWGLRNQTARGREAGIPHPGTFLIDRSLTVVERTFEQAYQERSSAAGILARIGGAVPPEAPRNVTGGQLTATLGASDSIVPPGGRVTLIIDLTPKPGMHVYAPGQTGYIPVSVTLDPSADFKVGPAKYPPPGTYYYAPLKETVKVYTKAVRITQDVTLGLSADLRRRATAKEPLVITGSLTYQACDDKVCYLKQTLPVSWTVTLTPFVR